MLDHVGIQVDDPRASADFYEAVLAPLGGRRMLDFGEAIGFGTETPVFWVGPVRPQAEGREDHIAFAARDRAAVRAFFDAAVAQGAEVLHEPKEWPIYHEGYYGAFVRDLDGNNIEAVCHAPE